MLRRFWVVSIFTCANPSYIHYLRRGEAHLKKHNIIWSSTSLPPLVVFFIVLVVVFWSKAKLLGELVSLGERATLGMNTMKSSSIFKLSYLFLSNAYELEYCLYML
jgi:hypothetical protein